MWVLLCNVVLHLLFFLAGLASISAKTISSFYGVWSVGGGSLITFSVLCSLLVIIVWLVFYLRNNAFKNFYRIGKWYLAKEFFLIFIVVLTSISYFESFNYGVKSKVRSFTGTDVFVKEVNTINQAMVYLPGEKSSYFFLNSCAEKEKREDGTQEITYVDSSGLSNYNYPNYAAIRNALRRPDALSYRNYCKKFFSPWSYEGLWDNKKISAENTQLLNTKNEAALRGILQSFFTLTSKYNIDSRLNIDTIINLVFSNGYHSGIKLIPEQEFRDEYGKSIQNPFYLTRYDLSRTLDFINDCLPNPENLEDQKSTWMIIGYVALSFSILLLCYRRFSRKVFLISVVGTIVWAIVVGLFAATSGESLTIPVLLLCLCFLFLVAPFVSMKENAAKTFSGVSLNWHVYLVPFVVMLLVWLISDYYSSQQIVHTNYDTADELKKLRFPISYWVTENTTNIFLVNLFLMIAYVALAFNKWAKRWVVMAEE